MTARRYQVRGLLGEGAFGAVYRAHAVGTGLSREVAIKVLHRDRSADPATVRRLRDEARMLALIRHRAIVRVDDLVELDGSWSIVMEYVEGCDVAALVRRGALPPSVALAVAEEIANALHAAWTQVGPDGRALRLVHRDIKPSNVRLTPLGEVKLLDFGVARAEFAGREAGTTRSAFGTLVYMAPERFEGRDTHEADVYALGVSLFEMLTGTSPGRTAADPGRQPPGGAQAAQWAGLAALSADLHALLARMLAYAPEQRPGALDCARALADLRARLRGERAEDWAARVVPAVVAEGKVALRADARTGTLLVEGPGTVEAPPRPVVPRWALAGAAVALLGGAVIVGGGAAAWAFRRGESALAAAPEPNEATAPPSIMTTAPPSTAVPGPARDARPLATAVADSAAQAPREVGTADDVGG
ncbi:MAG: protein kinase domain-containing protein, partial [Myxococcota bacterium]